MPNIVTMNAIDKFFPGVHALKSVEFDLVAGEVHALMGENGAGKSTLMKVLSGVYIADGGKVTVDGQAVNFKGPRDAQDHGIGIIHQELALMGDLNVAQNIFIGREPRNRFGIMNEAKLVENARKIFADMKIDIDVLTNVGSLSIAKQQMVEIAKALSYESRVLVMDEPTAALNDREINELFRIIANLKEKNVGIIYISHKMDEIKRIADRVTIMRDGEYIGTVEAKDTSIQTIISMMVGRELQTQVADVPDLSANETALSVKNISMGKFVKNVSFDVKQGEILGFAGLMGAGRTELARAIFGADKRDGGEIYVHSERVNIRSPKDAVIAGICYLSEDRKHFGLALDIDVRGNIGLTSLDRFSDKFGRMREKELAKTSQDYVKLLKIKTPHDQQEVRFLSGGNQQKVVIAKWLLRDCDILIFDEPTRGIDVGAKSEIYTLLRELAAQGKAVIVISSELPEVLQLSHRIAVMCEGNLTGFLPGGAETTQEQIMKLATATMNDPQIEEVA